MPPLSELAIFALAGHEPLFGGTFHFQTGIEWRESVVEMSYIAQKTRAMLYFQTHIVRGSYET